MVCLNSLPDDAARAKVLRALFDRETGAGFSMMKTVIGWTDFQSASQDWYTYDDTPDDTALEHFSIARDLGKQIEVRDGVRDGDQVILNPPVDLVEGKKVQVRPADAKS